MTRSQLRRMALAVAALAACAGPSSAADDPGELAAARQALTSANVVARAFYTRTARAALDAAGPILIVEPDTITLRRNGGEDRRIYTPQPYADLKALSHTALGVYSLLTPYADSDGDRAWRQDLAAFRTVLADVQAHVGVLGLRWDDGNRQREILAKSIAFADRTLADRRVTRAALSAYADDVGPALLGNLYDAAGAQLEALDRIVRAWRGAMTQDEWMRLHVVVLGPARPREGAAVFDYFAKVMGADAVGVRLIAAENVHDRGAALDLLATALVDRAMATDFFADAEKAQQGLVRDAGRRHIDRIMGAPGGAP